MSGGEGFLSTIMQIRASQNKQTAISRERLYVDKMVDFTMDNAGLLWQEEINYVPSLHHK